MIKYNKDTGMVEIDLASKFDRHHIRASFYHGGLFCFVIATIYWWEAIDWTHPYTIFCTTLIIIDYIAEMYDPHPENMGPWFKAHFHRFFESFEEE